MFFVRERDLLGISHNGGSRASHAHGLCITIHTVLLDSLAGRPAGRLGDPVTMGKRERDLGE
jgi:hypothetical protein